MREIFGNQALVVTPMQVDGTLDEKGLRQILDYVIDGGAHGVLILGSTGEFFSLSPAERREVIRIAAEHVRGRVALGVGTADTGSQLAGELAAYAEQAGADYVLVPPPYYAPLSMNTAEGIFQFFREIAVSTKATIMVYDGGSGIEVPLEVLRRLARETANVRAVKVNLAGPLKVTAIQEAGMTAFCGTDALTMLMMRYGADGFTLGVGNLQPAETTRLYDRCRAGDWDGAREIFYGTLLPLINVTLASLPQFIACFKMVLYWKGLIASPTVRRPLVPLDDVRTAELEAVARRVGLR